MPQFLNELNDAQRAAVLETTRPVFVLAGPGTGKTRVTTTKIAYLVKELGYQPDELLALTFSDKAAGEMKERVEELLPGAGEFQVSTFHSFCYQLIREHSLELGINPGSPVITDEHQQAFLLGAMDDLELEYFKIPSMPIDLAKTFQGAIARFKQENITVERLEDYLDKKEAELEKVSEDEGEPGEKKGREAKRKAKEKKKDQERFLGLRDFSRAYRAYEEFKEERGLLDFGDMQFLALKLLEGWPHVLSRLREKLRYIIVDEFQDTDFIQLQIIFKLAKKGNLTVVGDDDQSIYRFRGAYLTNFQELKDFFREQGQEPFQQVLGINYRCTATIQGLASSLIKHNTQREEKEITTNKREGDLPELICYQDDWEQAKGIARKAIKLNEEGTSWQDMAILVRRRADAAPIVELFQKSGLPLELSGSKNFFREPPVRAALAYLKVLADPMKHQPALSQLLMRPAHGILPEEIPKLSSFAKQKKLSLWEALRDLEGYSGDVPGLSAFREEMDRLFEFRGEGDILALVRKVLFCKDLFRVEIVKENLSGVRQLNRFMELTGQFLQIYPEAMLDDLLVYLQALSRLGLSGKNEKEGAADAVRLMTIHGSKGKEFPVVFIPCLNEGHLPSRYQRYKIDIPEELADGLSPSKEGKELHLQEERRLLYVATTRAEERLYLSQCKKYRANKQDAKPSVFLDEFLGTHGSCKEEEQQDDFPEPAEQETNHENAIFRELQTAVHRGEWQEGITALTALATSRGDDTTSLELPTRIDLESYVLGLAVRQMKPGAAQLPELSYSPSKLGLYEKCPRQFWYVHILKIPGEQKTFFALGSALHETIEIITLKLRDEGEVTLEEALGLLDRLWDSSAYDMKSKEEQDRAEAEEMLQKFLAHQAEKEGEILDVERWISLELLGKKVVGKVDRIDLLDDGLQVIDYKSSQNKTSRPDLKKDFQMVLYWLGAEKTYGKPVKEVGHWYLRMDREWMVEITPEEQEGVLERAREVIRKVEAGEFDPAPEYRTCRYCDYGDICDFRK